MSHLHAVPDPVDTEPVAKLSVKETAAEVRRALRATWPGTKFRLTMSRGTGYGYLDCTWVDGPTESQVQVVTDRYRDQRFDGMTDSTEQINRGTRYRSNGTLGQRTYSPEATAWALDVIAAHPGRYERDNDYLQNGVNTAAVHRVLATTDLSGGIPQ